MNTRISSISWGRWSAILSLGLSLAICLTNFTGDRTGFARNITCVGHYDCGLYAIPNSVYQSTGGTNFPGAPIPIEIVSLSLHSLPSSPAVPLPPPGTGATVDSFFDVFTELSLGGPDTFPIDSFFDITYRIDFAGTGVYDTEMLSMTLTGQIPVPIGPVPFIIRESPTMASRGKHMVQTVMPEGTFFVDSFFDVFTELSIDGGQTFHPGGAMRLELDRITPEPGSIALALIGAAGCGLFARRRPAA